MRINKPAILFTLGFAGTLWAGSAQANMEDMVACRNIHEDAARLACYDSAVEGVRAEITARDEAERAAIAEQNDQRSYFGMPEFTWPGGGAARNETSPDEFGQAALDQDRVRRGEDVESDDAVINEVSATVVEWGRNAYGKTFVVLENGHVWRMVEARNIPLRRNRENVVHIRRARLGSFMMSVNDVNAEFRVERIR